MAKVDDDYSLAGLTQESHENLNELISSDENKPIDPKTNFRLLLKEARALANIPSQILNFDDKIFQLSHTELVASVNQGLSQLKRLGNCSNSIASSKGAQERDWCKF